MWYNLNTDSQNSELVTVKWVENPLDVIGPKAGVTFLSCRWFLILG